MYRSTCLVLITLASEVISRSIGDGHSFLAPESTGAHHASEKCMAVHESVTPPPLDDKWDKLLCVDKGLTVLKPYQQAIRLGRGRTFMPVYSSEKLTKPSNLIKQAVIWLHGARQNANKYFCDAMYQTSDAYVDYRTLTLVPWFSNFYVTDKQWHNATGDDLVSACWSDKHSWMAGGEADNAHFTAFGVLDKIVLFLQSASDLFPNLNRIVFAGFSSGCQMLSRWSFFSRTLLPDFGRANTTALLGGCGTYMYLDDRRPAQKCSVLYHTGVDHNCNTFHSPAGVTGLPCQHYDRYGMSDNFAGSRFVHEGYLQSFGEFPIMIQSAIDDFPSKDVRYLFGSSDTCSCNTEGFTNADTCYSKLNYTCMPNAFGGSRGGNMCCDSGQSNALPHSCSALLQGSNRLQRGLNYVDYLRHFYRERNVTFKPQVRVFDGSHDSTQCFSSDQFREWAFEEGNDPYAFDVPSPTTAPPSAPLPTSTSTVGLTTTSVWTTTAWTTATPVTTTTFRPQPEATDQAQPMDAMPSMPEPLGDAGTPANVTQSASVGNAAPPPDVTPSAPIPPGSAAFPTGGAPRTAAVAIVP